MKVFKKLHRSLVLLDFPMLLFFVLLFFLAVNILNYGYFKTRNAYAFQVSPLPADNLVVNPWFRSVAKPTGPGFDYWVNVNNEWILSQKL